MGIPVPTRYAKIHMLKAARAPGAKRPYAHRRLSELPPPRYLHWYWVRIAPGYGKHMLQKAYQYRYPRNTLKSIYAKIHMLKDTQGRALPPCSYRPPCTTAAGQDAARGPEDLQASSHWGRPRRCVLRAEQPSSWVASAWLSMGRAGPDVRALACGRGRRWVQREVQTRRMLVSAVSR